MNNLDFEVLVDESLANITSVPQLLKFLNNYVLSIVNDYEDDGWRYPKFQSFIWNNIAETALSQRERMALIDQSHSSLVAAAQNLRLTDADKIGKGSEIAEIFLYGIMRQHFGALPVVPKIFYKQNIQDNAKGADSVHIVLNGDGFTLWFGEAKFYNSIEDGRLDSIVDSVMKSLSTEKMKKENSIITNVSDLDFLSISEELCKSIKSSLDNRNSIDGLKNKINVPILVLHECKITKSAIEYSNKYKEDIIKVHLEKAINYFSKQVKKSQSVNKYGDIKFHIIFFPVPNKKKIVDAFVDAVAFYKGWA